MEEHEILNYTGNLTTKLFGDVYKKVKNSSITNKKRKKVYRRLETDSSEDEKKKFSNSKASVEIQTEEYYNLQEEIAKKDKEIYELKRMLSQTKKKIVIDKNKKNEQKIIENTETLLNLQAKSKKDLQSLSGVSSPEIFSNETGFLLKNANKFQNPRPNIEEIVFVSKKNEFSSEKSLGEIGLRTISRNDFIKLEMNFGETKDSVKISTRKLDLSPEKSQNKIKTEKSKTTGDNFIESTEKTPSKNNNVIDKKFKMINQSPIKDLVTYEEAYVQTEDMQRENIDLEISIKNPEAQKFGNKPRIDETPKNSKSTNPDTINENKDSSFEENDSIMKSLVSPKSIDLSPSLKDIQKNEPDISDDQNVQELEKLLLNQGSFINLGDSQEKLKNLFQTSQKPSELASKTFSKKFNENKVEFSIGQEEMLEPWNIIESPKLKDEYSFQPFFPAIESNLPKDTSIKNQDKINRKKIKSEAKRSRNSSLPWIEEPLVLPTKKPETKIKKITKTRPKTEEQKSLPTKRLNESIKLSDKKRPLPFLPIKNSKPPQASRAHSHAKPKRKKLHTQKGNNSSAIKESILDDIIFDEDQDSATWNKLMLRFRQNPTIISKLLKSNSRPNTESLSIPKSKHKKFEKINGVEYLGRQSFASQKEEAIMINTTIDHRPISAPEFVKTSVNFPGKKIKDPDWGNSVLDNYVSQNKKNFNIYGDPSLLSNQMIEEISKSLFNNSLSLDDQKKYFLKAMSTLSTLKKELLLPEFWIAVPPFSYESLAQALSKCSKLLRARALTVKAIELIHSRENTLLEIMSQSDPGQNPQKFKNLEKVNEELLQVLIFWKYMELPFSSFLYLGEDYYAKIHEDNSNLAVLFSDFQADDMFNCDKSAESFFVDF